MWTIQDSIKQRLAGAEEAVLKAKQGKKKKIHQVGNLDLTFHSHKGLAKKRHYFAKKVFGKRQI